VGDDQTVTITTELASRLFHHPTTSVKERQLILAGLAVTARHRGCIELVYELIPQVGRYDEPDRQSSLDNLIRSIQSSYPLPM
jgi:hypothetical protein